MALRLASRLGAAAGSAYRAWATRRVDDTVAGALRAARSTMMRKTYCVLVTGGDGSPPSARVAHPFRPREDWTVVVGTDPSSRKVNEVRRTGHCLLVYEDDRRLAGATVECAAEVVEDPDQSPRHFMPTWRAFWPDGPDDSFVAIVCTPVAIEVWDGMRGITPAPFGRASKRLVRSHDGWREP